MGDPVYIGPSPPPPALPDEPVGYEEGVYYVIVDIYYDTTGKTGCDMAWVKRDRCCSAWIYFSDWIDNNYECVAGHELKYYNGLSAQRLFYVQGPYATMWDCYTAHN